MDVTDVLGFALTFLSGVAVIVLAFVIQNFLQDRHSRTSAKFDLASEMRQNQHHQTVSSYITLEDDAYKRYRQAGYLASLDQQAQESLRELYSRIRDKNGLIAIYLVALPYGGTPMVTGGNTPAPLANVIADIGTRIDELLTKTLPLLE